MYDADGAGTASQPRQIDLTKASDWELVNQFAGDGGVAKLESAIATGSNWSLGTGLESTATDTAGKATITNMPLSFYLVKETTTPDTVTVTKTTDDFVVTMPLANTDNDTKATTPWLYTVNVMPKNSVADPSKKEILNSSKIGAVADPSKDTVDWKITYVVPSYTTGATYFKSVSITDTLASALGTAADVSNITVAKGGTTLTENTDYTITRDGQKFTVALAQTLDKDTAIAGNDAVNVAPGDVITITFTTKYTADGQTTNTFTADSTDSNGNQKTTTPAETNTPYITEGSFKFTKVDSQTTSKVLKDAVFKACEANDDHNGCKKTEGTYLQDATAQADATFTSGADGVVTGTLLIAKGTGTPVTSKWFCLVETQAPAGYAKLADPLCFNLSSTNTQASPLMVNSAGQTDGKVVNAVSTSWIPFLPNTGAAGQVLLAIVGILLASGAVVMAIAVRRRSSK